MIEYLDNWIREDIKKRIGKQRWKHSIRVADVSLKLANIYNENKKNAYIAGLLHDNGKVGDKSELLNLLVKFDIIETNAYDTQLELLHGKLGKVIAENEYGIKNKDILNAIEYHTTGRKKMSKLEKIVFIADYIEPKRNFKGLEEVRELVKFDLDKSILLALNQNIRYLIDKDIVISNESIDARNYLLTTK